MIGLFLTLFTHQITIKKHYQVPEVQSQKQEKNRQHIYKIARPCDDFVELFIMSQVLKNLSNFLPPPLVALIEKIDISLKHEAKVLIAPLILLAMMTIYFAMSFQRAHSKKIHSDDANLEDSVLSTSTLKTSDYGDSVIFIGPSLSGKTFLFHKLINTLSEGDHHLESVPQTVISLRANIEIVQSNEDTNKPKKSRGIRLVDFPGHVQLMKNQLAPLLQPGNSQYATRIILVIDSTKAIHEAAKLIYQTIFCDPNLLQAWQRRQRSDEKDVLKILVVCNKAAEKDAKNWRRIKLQLKAELEQCHKLEHLDDSKLDNSHNEIDHGKSRTVASLLKETINLDELGPDIPFEFHFISVSGSSSDDPNFNALRAFVLDGVILERNVPLIRIK